MSASDFNIYYIYFSCFNGIRLDVIGYYCQMVAAMCL